MFLIHLVFCTAIVASILAIIDWCLINHNTFIQILDEKKIQEIIIWRIKPLSSRKTVEYVLITDSSENAIACKKIVYKFIKYYIIDNKNNKFKLSMDDNIEVVYDFTELNKRIRKIGNTKWSQQVFVISDC